MEPYLISVEHLFILYFQKVFDSVLFQIICFTLYNAKAFLPLICQSSVINKFAPGVKPEHIQAGSTSYRWGEQLGGNRLNRLPVL